MKQTYFKSTLIIACMAAALFSCEPKSGSGGEGTPRTIKKPKETITLERAHTMYKSYQPRYNALTEHRNGEEDSRYGWHSLDFYKNYIAYLEHAAKKVDMEVSGLRLYYAAYPEGDNMSGEQGGYQTYMFVPTYYNKELGKHIAFDPLHMDENGKPIPLHQVILYGKNEKTYGQVKSSQEKGYEVKFAGMLQDGSDETLSSIANWGEMCPFNCPEEIGD